MRGHGPCRYAGTVFSLWVRQPQSFAGRVWNLAQSATPIVPLTFIVLKLTGAITWSWWWVLSPIWISGILFALWLCLLLSLFLTAWLVG